MEAVPRHAHVLGCGVESPGQTAVMWLRTELCRRLEGWAVSTTGAEIQELSP